MKLRAITLENVRRFTDPVRVGGISDGLNVLCEPNEHGKSTLFDALQALFLLPHGSKAREVAALKPRAGGAPAVSVDVETGEGRFTLSKRWLSRPHAAVTSEGRLVAQADAAEAWIAGLLGGAEGGPAGLVWVRQGMTALGGGTKRDEDAARAARRDLMHAVGHEVEAMTGGRRMDHALARCREDLELYATGRTRNPRRGGPWKAAQERVSDLTDTRESLAATARMLHEALEARRRVRRDLAAIESPEAEADRQARLRAARSAHAAAERHAERVATEARKLETAKLAVTGAAGRLDALRETLAEARSTATQAAAAGQDAEAGVAARLDADRAMDAAGTALAEARGRVAACDTARREAARRAAARDGAARRSELAARLARAEAARADMERAAAAARQGPDADALRTLDRLTADLQAARAARDAAATQATMSYLPGSSGRVLRDGIPLEDGRPIPVTRHAMLEIDGIGTLELRPEPGPGDGAVEMAQAALACALERIGAATPAEARAAGETRAEAERLMGEARAVLVSLAPDGIETLRAALASIPGMATEPEADGPDLETAEATLAEAETARVAAQAARDAAAERLSDARSRAARAEAARDAARERLTRAEAAHARHGEATEAGLDEAFRRARTELETAATLHREAARTAPDLDAASATLARAQSVVDRAREDVARLRPELARLDERIARGAGDAVEERLAETEEALTAAREDLARIEHEVAVLIRLEEALEDAKRHARERFFAPVAAELRPLLRLLWPDAELDWADDTLLPQALVRDGTTEPVEILSGGTQEQVALLVRLAFARLLAKAGRHAPVILDDALVFTDDDRIERMFDALHRQARDLQILVLTCRQRAFRDLGGHTLRLETVAEAATAG